jgi:hypothetical protein
MVPLAETKAQILAGAFIPLQINIREPVTALPPVLPAYEHTRSRYTGKETPAFKFSFGYNWIR